MPASLGRVMYLAPLAFGMNPTVDAVAHGLNQSLKSAGVDLYVRYIGFGGDQWVEDSTEAVKQAVSARFDAVVIWMIDPMQPSAAVEHARSRDLPVYSIEKPGFEVEGSVAWPNFNQGVYMVQHLSSLLPAAADIGIIGGPAAVDDVELVLGLLHGAEVCGLNVVNDPWDDRYRNMSDVKAGGEMAARRVLSDFRELMGLIPFNDETMLGTLEALDEGGAALGGIPMVSRNGTPKAVEAVLAGRSAGTWDIDPIGIGEMVSSMVLDGLRSTRKTAGDCRLSPVGRMITKATVSDWTSWEERGFATAPTEWCH